MYVCNGSEETGVYKLSTRTVIPHTSSMLFSFI